MAHVLFDADVVIQEIRGGWYAALLAELSAHGMRTGTVRGGAAPAAASAGDESRML